VSSPNDNAFDEYLDRQSPVSQRYRALGDDPVPEHLDQSVLAQARAAIESGNDELALVRSRRRRLAQWGVPVALAASTVIVVSIVIRSGTQHEVLSPSMPRAAPPPASAPPMAQAAKPQPEAQESANVVMIAPPRDAVTEFSSLAPSPATSPADRAPTVLNERLVVLPQVRSEPAVVPPAALPAPEIAENRERAAESEKRRVDAAGAAAMRQEQETTSRQSAREQITVTAMRRQEIAQDVPLAIAVAPVTTLDAEIFHRDPDDWLEHIRQLRRDGQQEAADREWKQFQETHPDHPVAETDLARPPQR